MYYLANTVVSRIGVENTVVLFFAGMLFVLYAIWGRQSNPPGRIWRLGIWIPTIMSCWMVYSGWSDFSSLMSMLKQAEALTNEQYTLLLDESRSRSIMVMCVGLGTSAFLGWFVKRNVRRTESAIALAGTRKKEHPEPV